MGAMYSNKVKHWVFITSPENYRICEKFNVFGVDERYMVTCLHHISPGDLAFFYVTGEQVFKGPWKVSRGCTHDPNHPAVSEWRKGRQDRNYEYVIPLERCADFGTCDLWLVFDRLLFITNRLKKKGRVKWSDQFQFSIISIREEDFHTLLECASRS